MEKTTFPLLVQRPMNLRTSFSDVDGLVVEQSPNDGTRAHLSVRFLLQSANLKRQNVSMYYRVPGICASTETPSRSLSTQSQNPLQRCGRRAFVFSQKRVFHAFLAFGLHVDHMLPLPIIKSPSEVNVVAMLTDLQRLRRELRCSSPLPTLSQRLAGPGGVKNK